MLLVRFTWVLFDISKDLAQEHNIAKSNSKIVAKMTKAYDQLWEKSISHLENEQAIGTKMIVD